MKAREQPRHETDTAGPTTRTDTPAQPTDTPHATRHAAPQLALIAWLLAGLLFLATTYALHLARSFLLPIALALLLTGILRPAAGALRRHGLPRQLAAAVIVLALLTSSAALAYYLSGPAVAWVEKAPVGLERLEQRLRSVKLSLEKLTQATDRMSELAQMGGKDARTATLVESDTVLVQLANATQATLAEGLLTLILLYFFLASGSTLFARVLALLPAVKQPSVLACAEQAKRQISVYLGTVTSINFCLGGAASFVLLLFGVPNPVLWGVMLGALTYVPYLGPVIAILVIAAVSLISIEDPVLAIGAPLVCATLSALEGHFITPVVLGKSLALNPVVIFLALMFWSFVWGIAGAIMAVPILMTFKIACDHVEALQGVGRLLGMRQN